MGYAQLLSRDQRRKRDMAPHDNIGQPRPARVQESGQHQLYVDASEHELDYLLQTLVVNRWEGNIGMTPRHFGARVRSGREESKAQTLDQRALQVAGGNTNLVAGRLRFARKGDEWMQTAKADRAGEQHAHDGALCGLQDGKGKTALVA